MGLSMRCHIKLHLFSSLISSCLSPIQILVVQLNGVHDITFTIDFGALNCSHFLVILRSTLKIFRHIFEEQVAPLILDVEEEAEDEHHVHQADEDDHHHPRVD